MVVVPRNLQETLIQVRPFGPDNARIMIVGDFPSDNDTKLGMPFQSTSGLEFDRILADAGLRRDKLFLTMICRQAPPGGKLDSWMPKTKKAQSDPSVVGYPTFQGKKVHPAIQFGVDLLRQEILRVKPNVIVAFGDLALWVLTGNTGLTKWRGSKLTTSLLGDALPHEPKVIPTHSLGAVLRQYPLRGQVVHDLKTVHRESLSPTYTTTPYSFLIRPSFGQTMDALSALLRDAHAALSRGDTLLLGNDIETRAGHIACIGIASSPHSALCIPLMCVERPSGYWSEDEEFRILTLLRELLLHPAVRSIGQNFIYDAQYYWRWLLYLPNFGGDTMLAQHSLFSVMPKSLDFLSSLYCSHHVYWKDDGKNWDPSMDEDQLWSYNCVDACRTLEIWHAEQSTTKAMGMQAVATFQQSLFDPVLYAMNRGIRYNTSLLKEFKTQLEGEVASREAWLREVLGFSLNIKSPAQMQDLFYAQFKQTPILHRKTHNPTCDDEALRKIAIREPLLRPVVQRITELRSLGVFLSTFLGASRDVDGRMRCSFNIAGTTTYRFSSSKNAFGSGLNLQNISSGGGDDSPEELASGASGLIMPNLRTLFIPDDGYEFFDIDLSSADLRIVVWESDESEMKALLAAGLDPYTEIAKEFYKDQSITKKDPRRQTFKSFAHGTHYLGTPEGLADRLGLDRQVAEQTQAWYFRRFPRIKKAQDALVRRVRMERKVENIFGYKYFIFDRIEGTVLNEVAAWIPQSTVACIINRGMRKLWDTERRVEVLLQVHDSLAGQFPIALREELVPKIVSACQVPLPYAGDPLVIPVEVHTSTESWGKCK